MGMQSDCGSLNAKSRRSHLVVALLVDLFAVSVRVTMVLSLPG